MPEDSNVTIERISEIILHNTPQYEIIKKIAEKDVGKEKLAEIEKFLEERQESKSITEIKQIVFEDASKVSDQNINDIVDAFIKMRPDKTLSQVDNKSINDVLILFNQWMAIGKGQQEQVLSNNKLQDDPLSRVKNLLTSEIEEQVSVLRSSFPEAEELYKAHIPTPHLVQEFYSTQNKVYDLGQGAQFVHGEHCDHPHGEYQGKALYKDHSERLQ